MKAKVLLVVTVIGAAVVVRLTLSRPTAPDPPRRVTVAPAVRVAAAPVKEKRPRPVDRLPRAALIRPMQQDGRIEPPWLSCEELERRIRADSVDGVLSEMRVTRSSPSEELLCEALDHCAYVLRDDPGQLWFQLFSRTRFAGSEEFDLFLGRRPPETRLVPRFVAMSQCGGALLRTIRDTRGGALSVAVSPDGTRIASGHGKANTVLYDFATGRELWSIQVNSGMVDCVAFSPDGRLIGTASNDRSVKVLDAETGEVLRELGAHSEGAYTLAFSPDGETVVSGSWGRWNDEHQEELAILWKTATGEKLRAFNGHEFNVKSVRFSPDGNTLLTAGYDETLRLWDVDTGELLRTTVAHDTSLSHAEFSPDGQLIASSAFDETTIKLWNVATGKQIGVMDDHRIGVTLTAFSPDGRFLASAGQAGEVKLWDVAERRLVREVGRHGGIVNSVAFTPNGRYLVSGSSDESIRVWDLEASEPTSLRTWHNGISAVRFSPDGATLATAGRNSLIRLWDAETGECRKTLKCDADLTTELAFSPSGKWLASASPDPYFRIWNLETDTLVHKLEGPRLERHQSFPSMSAVRSLAFSPDDRTVAAGSHSFVRLWDVETGRSIADLEGHGNIVHAVMFSPDGRTLYSSSSGERAIWVWDVESHERVREIRTTRGALDMVLSSDGATITACSNARVIEQYDAATAELRRQLKGHRNYVKTLTMLGRDRVVTAGLDGFLKVWNANSGELIDTYSFDERFRSVDAHPSGRIAAGGTGGLIHLMEWTEH